MKSVLVAHRGEPESWPENSRIGFEAVLNAGALFVETDVQVTADGIPVLSHEASLLKITGVDIAVVEADFQTVQRLSAGYPGRFGDRYVAEKIMRLEEFASLLKAWPDARAFVEIKFASIQAHGAERVVDIVLTALAGVLDQCIIISFEYAALLRVRHVSTLPIGFVLPEWSEETRSMAVALAPEYLFCNRSRLPPATESLWPGSWNWVVYTVNDEIEVQQYLSRGMDMVETNVISRLLAVDDSR